MSELFDLTKCNMCPIKCGINRTESVGVCKSKNLKIAKYYLHPFEEPCISFIKGSGTVFFCGCPLKCVFCQNYELSRNERGKEITIRELANIFKELENMGAENINLVNPTHYLEHIAQAFEIYRPGIPVVYNSSGYENIESLEKFDKYVDIYLPDLKFFSKETSKRYTGKSNYFEIASEALKFMAKKTLVFNEGKMLSGTVVRHLILPLNTDDSIEILKWYAENLSTNTYLSIMCQYTPYGEIDDFPELKRKITSREYDKVINFAMELNLDKVYLQERKSASESFIPKWDF